MSDDIKIGDHVPLAVIEQAHIRKVVGTSRTLGEAAVTLGIDWATLYRKRRSWGDHTPGRRGRKKTVAAVEPAAPVAPVVEPVTVVKQPVQRIGTMSWRVQPPEGMPMEIHNLGFWSVLRIGLRLLEPKSETAALWVKYQALEIVECLPMWSAKTIQGERRNGNHVGWLAVQSTVPMMTHFTGWNVYLDENMEVPFSMRCNGKSINGMFE